SCHGCHGSCYGSCYGSCSGSCYGSCSGSCYGSGYVPSYGCSGYGCMGSVYGSYGCVGYGPPVYGAPVGVPADKGTKFDSGARPDDKKDVDKKDMDKKDMDKKDTDKKDVGANLKFVLPANAKLYVDGRLTGGNGAERTFYTPPLAPGQQY